MGKPNKAITQRVKIVDYIKEHGFITSLLAYEHLNVTQLAARIFELKKMGVEFVTTRVNLPDTHYVEYRLAEKG